MDEAIEHTLFLHREVNIYKIPLRQGAGGYKSGEWTNGDKIFTGRIRVIAKGELCEVRVEDPANGQLFVVCPIRPGQRLQAVEPVTDSSRYFVIRVENPVNGQHAFLGLGFVERGPAFDFNVSLTDHDKQSQRVNMQQLATSGTQQSGVVNSTLALSQQDAAMLYKQQDMSLKDGETLKINVKKPSNKSGSFLSRTAESGGGGLVGLAPPPGPGMAPSTMPGMASTTSSALRGNQQQQQQPQMQNKNATAPSSWTAFS